MVEVVAEEGSPVVSEVGKRGAQAIARERRRRRRPNIEGPKRTIEVVFSESEWAKVSQLAEQANCTVPWFVVQAAVDPVPASSDGARLSTATVNAIVTALMEATGALDEVRLQELAPLGGNVNQIAHAANISGDVAEEALETFAEVRELMADLRMRAEEISATAKQVRR
ncbi:plasmid mobilization relaxosome protein MobC [Nocardia brasiliensis]|uniref:plasmid mobilization relaxosome protein MobC n=1 Tax=Nocardia brasiliensis TaxID=37326 RepID=UPI00340F84F8